MKTELAVTVLSLAALLFVGCASQQSRHAPREVNILGGVIEGEERAFDEVGPLTIGLKASEVNPGAKLTGHKVTFLWGLITIVDE